MLSLVGGLRSIPIYPKRELFVLSLEKNRELFRRDHKIGRLGGGRGLAGRSWVEGNSFYPLVGGKRTNFFPCKHFRSVFHSSTAKFWLSLQAGATFLAYKLSLKDDSGKGVLNPSFRDIFSPEANPRYVWLIKSSFYFKTM